MAPIDRQKPLNRLLAVNLESPRRSFCQSVSFIVPFFAYFEQLITQAGQLWLIFSPTEFFLQLQSPNERMSPQQLDAVKLSAAFSELTTMANKQ